jgi:hypothetical protein
MGEDQTAFRFFVTNPVAKRSLGRTRSSLVDDIKMDLREIAHGGMDSIGLAKGRYQWREIGARC